jgi:hypothetical protein
MKLAGRRRLTPISKRLTPSDNPGLLATAEVAPWGLADDVGRRLDGLFSLGDGGREIDEIEFREVFNLMDEGGKSGLEFPEGGILFCAGGGGDDGAQFSHTMFRRGRHNDSSFAEIGELGCRVLLVRGRRMP